MEKEIIYWTSVNSSKGQVIVMATEKGICWVGTPGTSLEKGKNGWKKIWT